MLDRKAFQGYAVIVTGAAAGIGAGTARQFAAHGADVELVDISMDDAQKAAFELEKPGTRSFGYHADATKSAEVNAAVEE